MIFYLISIIEAEWNNYDFFLQKNLLLLSAER